MERIFCQVDGKLISENKKGMKKRLIQAIDSAKGDHMVDYITEIDNAGNRSYEIKIYIPYPGERRL